MAPAHGMCRNGGPHRVRGPRPKADPAEPSVESPRSTLSRGHPTTATRSVRT
jgi:hypothetical protein